MARTFAVDLVERNSNRFKTTADQPLPSQNGVRPVLSSWKEIAGYLGKGVRTVQRWERELGLPVRRPRGHKSRIILAYPEELKSWAMPRSSHWEASPYGDVAVAPAKDQAGPAPGLAAD
jgi:hypothetical protein